MNLLVKPSSLEGKVFIPPSKSHSMRAILFGSLAKGETIVKQYLPSPDSIAMIDACRKLGAKILIQKDTLIIDGVAGKPKLPDDVIDAQNSGQVLRFVGAIAGLIDGYTIISGDHSIRTNRPVQPLLDGLKHLGAFAVSSKEDGFAPIIIKGPLKPGKTALDGEDSQPVTALLIASSFLDGKTEITVTNPGEKPWIELTLHWLDFLGISCENEKYEKYTVQGKESYSGFHYSVPGDFSSVSFPLIAALITDSEIVIENIDTNDPQGDKKILDVVKKMGANLEVHQNKVIVKKGSKLKGITVDVNDLIDAVPILAVLGCFSEGEMKITNAKIARKKECDRLASITKELKKMGASIEEKEDELIVKQSDLTGSVVESYNDHRMAMALFVAALRAKGETKVMNAECMKKSYPDFVQHMEQLGANVEVIE